jgi:hypothetical protein
MTCGIASERILTMPNLLHRDADAHAARELRACHMIQYNFRGCRARRKIEVLR